MRGFALGIAAGMAVSTAVAVACMPKKTAFRKRMGRTMKTVVDFVDDLGDVMRS